jgi:5'-phosphate synthase pdxT subunit
LIDLDVARNAYGRQVDSFVAPLKVSGLSPEFPGVFIRAPRFASAGPRVSVLGSLNGNPVAARQGPIFVTAFHPELTADTRIHQYFLTQVCAAAGAGDDGRFSNPTPV